jgi:RAMP superfamily
MPVLEITVRGHLLVAGGQASEAGAHLTTARRRHQGQLVPYIPATALRGAIRIQLESLLKGAGRGAEVVEPYVAEGQEPFDPGSTVARIFGFSGPAGKRNGSGEGAVRLGDALPVNPDRAAAALQVRPGVELEDFTATAEDKKLFFREVAEISAEALVFRAALAVVGGLDDQDLELLQIAAETTDSIGAGKAKGGGEVSIRWIAEGSSPAARVTGDPSTATRARLLFTLVEPAHFGDGGPYGNHHATRTYIPGATVRGAVAWTLLRNGRIKAEEDAFQALFLGVAAGSFGDALLVADAESEPDLFSATARQRRGVKHDVQNILVPELARQRINELLVVRGQYLRADDGDLRFDPFEEARSARGLVRHTRTRVSLDRWTGTAAAGRLFSIEQIDPYLSVENDRNAIPARFVSWVEGLTPVTAGLLNQLGGLTVLIGAGRKHGLGLVEVDIRFESDPKVTPAETVRSLAASLDQHITVLSSRAKIETPPTAEDRLPLVLVARSDYVPSGPGIDHPLAEPELAGLAPNVSGPIRRFLHQSFTGGYDQRPASGAPLKELLAAMGAGSVFVYGLAEEDLDSTLGLLLPVLRRGVGRLVHSGCGRFGLFELEVAKEKEMSTDLSPNAKRWLVEEAEKILDRVKADRAFRNQTSQLRNMVQITQRESEVPVLRNFIRYQSGRKATQRFWGLVQAEIIRVLDEISSRFPGEDEKGSEERRTAIQSFFGYLVRHYVYLNEMSAR